MPIGVKRGTAAIAMLDVATHLDELRAILVVLDGADGDDVDRGRQEVGRIEAAERGVQVAIAGEADDRQLVLRGDGGRVAKLDARRVGERDMQQGDIVLLEGADVNLASPSDSAPRAVWRVRPECCRSLSIRQSSWWTERSSTSASRSVERGAMPSAGTTPLATSLGVTMKPRPRHAALLFSAIAMSTAARPLW